MKSRGRCREEKGAQEDDGNPVTDKQRSARGGVLASSDMGFTVRFLLSAVVLALCTAHTQLNDTQSVGVSNAKGRALGVTSSNLTQQESALDDVSMEEDDQIPCEEGKKIEHGCEEICTCHNGKLLCESRCQGPLVRSVLGSHDPDCHLRPTQDPCCSTLVCTHTEHPDATGEKCMHNNKTYHIGETFNDGCAEICECQTSGEVTCKPRCPENNRTAPSDSCLSVPDSKDPCCSVLYCDVDAGDDVGLELEDEDDNMDMKLVSAVPLNNSAVILNFEKPNYPEKIQAETSLDKTSWFPAQTNGQIVPNLSSGKTYYFRVLGHGITSNVVSAVLPSISTNSSTCEYKGKTYKKGQEFHDECTAYCVCEEAGVECATIECPTDFGLDVLDPHCLAWETQPANFTPSPPHCCPETVVCKNNGSCIYRGESFENWADIPDKLSGCENKCYCASGNVTCRPRCPPLPARPPHDIQCPPNTAILSHSADDHCCLHWTCPPNNGVASPHGVPGFPPHPHQIANGITVHTLDAIDEHTVKLIFSVPPVLVGLHGQVELRYTADKKNSDPSTWPQQILAPPNNLIATPELEFELGGLQPDTEYKIKITLVMRDLQNSPASQVLVVKTPSSVKSTTTAYPPMIPIEAELRVDKTNSTWATLSWRKLKESEFQFVDGIQLRYKLREADIYQATPLIHRAITSYTLTDLKPDSEYEVGIFFIPFPGQTTELQDSQFVHLSTVIENDPYKFDLMLDVHHIKSTSVEISWDSVPFPEDKYVNIFRAIYQTDGGKEDSYLFKTPKRDSMTSILIQGLKPDTRYRLWLEAYLTNGRIKKSNVKDFTTKHGIISGADVFQGKLEGTPLGESGDYYGPLVGVSILAIIAILAVVGLSVLLAKKHGHNKAPITAAVNRKPTPHTAAYDNPSYKISD